MDWRRLTAELTSLVLAHFDADGELLWSNAGFQRLLGADLSTAWRRFSAPGLQPWLGMTPDALTCVHDGLLTLAVAGDRMTTLKGRVHVGPDGLWVVAGYDIAEFERISAAMLDLNQQLLDTQRALAKTNRHLRKREAEVEALTRNDALTGVLNRRGLDAALAVEATRQTRLELPLSLVIFDLDHFKQINDGHGHAVGDVVLRAIGQLLRQMARQTDHVARFGGEEFVVLLPMTTIDDALLFAERLRQAVQELDLPDSLCVTISLGVTQWQAGDSAESAFVRADGALYQAKQGGRNRVALAQTTAT